MRTSYRDQYKAHVEMKLCNYRKEEIHSSKCYYKLDQIAPSCYVERSLINNLRIQVYTRLDSRKANILWRYLD